MLATSQEGVIRACDLMGGCGTHGTLTGMIIYIILIVGPSTLCSGYKNMTQIVTNASPSSGEAKGRST